MSSLRDLTVFCSCMVLLMVPHSHGSRIIGGKEVKPHSLPFMALLRRLTRCGGTLIDPSWVLSAAHCADFDKVMLGVHSTEDEETNARQVIKIEKQIRHPKYNKYTHDSDLMLIKLETPAVETETVKPLKLQETIKDPAGGTRCLVAGWGKTDPDSLYLSDVLMSVNLYVIERTMCNSKYWYNMVTSNMVCAFRNGQKRVSTCQGDSGGPLLCNGVQVGVTSFGQKCGLLPGVYAFLSDTQLQWIKQTMEEYEM